MNRGERFHFPGDPYNERHVSGAERRKKTFADLLRFISAGAKPPRAWLISVPGAELVRLECLPESDIPAQLIDLGYRLIREDDGERILATAIEERFVRGPNGNLMPISLGSSHQVAEVRRHAGVIRTARWRFTI